MGKQIRIYLADNSVSGIRHAEITNWIGQALACPRSRFQFLRDWPEVKTPGVYFLFGVSEETGAEAVYIGEAEVVFERLHAHFNSKDFWTELIAFTSKDDNLTKAHVRYLESRLIQLAIGAGRYQVKNSATPQLPSLPRADKDAMEEYLETARILLGVLGHRVIEALVIKPAQATIFQALDALNQNVLPKDIEKTVISGSPIFQLQIKDIVATATTTDEGIVVLAESHAAEKTKSSLSNGYWILREKLIKSGVLVQSDTKLVFSKDHLFNSPSQAAAVVVGYSINGREAWKLSNGTTYAIYESKTSEALLDELEKI